MEDLVRPNQAPQKAAGFRAPSTVGLNEGVPEVTFGDGGSGQSDDGPYARVDEPEDYSWWPRLRMLMAGGQEVVSEWKDVSASFEINPNVCSVWRLRCQSASLALTFAAVEAPSWIAKLLVWSGVKRICTTEIIIDWQSASDPRTLTLSGVRFPDGEAPEWTATTGRDVVIVQTTSDSEKYGFVAGLNVGVPS